MEFVIGVVLAVAVGAMARFVGLDRDRAFYPTVTMVVASLYVLFAVIGGSTHALLVELLVMAVFIAAALVGFRRSLWLVVAALAGHGIFDLFHGGLIENAGVPSWWPNFCMTYDVVAAGCLAFLLHTSRTRAARTPPSDAGDAHTARHRL